MQRIVNLPPFKITPNLVDVKLDQQSSSSYIEGRQSPITLSLTYAINHKGNEDHVKRCPSAGERSELNTT
ncbi:unnamed protein product [Rotaria sp. Silwood2]|nr:unnamed protein product [Rotaria sp. Silwood2]CAF4217648.1 unnamed protein product [Rotaria sp. Silwood2]